jgi:hypothetical protein
MLTQDAQSFQTSIDEYSPAVQLRHFGVHNGCSARHLAQQPEVSDPCCFVLLLVHKTSQGVC